MRAALFTTRRGHGRGGSRSSYRKTRFMAAEVAVNCIFKMQFQHHDKVVETDMSLRPKYL
jgi:hypothetical protein